MNDDELLALLAGAYPPVEAAPPPEVIDSLRRAAATRAVLVAVRSPRPHRVRRRTAAHVAVAVVLVSTGSAYAAAAGLPAPVRSAARIVGLDNTPPGIKDLHAAERRLRQALIDHDGSEAVRQAAIVGDRLSKLSAADRARERVAADPLLDRVDQVDRVDREQTASVPPVTAPLSTPAGPGDQGDRGDGGAPGSPAPAPAQPPDEPRSTPPNTEDKVAAPAPASTPPVPSGSQTQSIATAPTGRVSPLPAETTTAAPGDPAGTEPPPAPAEPGGP